MMEDRTNLLIRYQQMIFFFFFFVCFCFQTEEDYIPYPSVHEVDCVAVTFFSFSTLPFTLVSFLAVFSCCASDVCLRFWNRYWVEKAPFLSSSCLSLEGTGSRAPTMMSATQWTASRDSLCLPTPEPSWSVTQQHRCTGNTSWGRSVTSGPVLLICLFNICHLD